MGLEPFRKECERMEEEVEVAKLMVPRRDLRRFH
jgi:hypothetical protein